MTHFSKLVATPGFYTHKRTGYPVLATQFTDPNHTFFGNVPIKVEMKRATVILGSNEYRLELGEWLIQPLLEQQYMVADGGYCTTVVHSSFTSNYIPFIRPTPLPSSEENVRAGVRHLITVAGDDPTRQGLVETPERFRKAWEYWNRGYKQDPAAVLKTFEDGAEKCDEMVTQLNIRIWSRCEHHLAPFFGRAHIAYVPNGKIVGLSKLTRVARIFAARLQVQERLTDQIADCLQVHLDPKGVAVVLDCRHTCMESRGVEEHGTTTITTALRGVFKENPSARAEFMSYVQTAKKV